MTAGPLEVLAGAAGVLPCCRLVGAVGFGAIHIQVKSVRTHAEAAFCGDPVLPVLDLGIEELLDVAALQADQVVVVVAFVQLENSLAGFEVMAFEQAGLFELGKHPVNRGQADIHVFGDEQAIDVFGGQVAVFGFLEKIEDLEPRESCLQADTFETLGIAGHGGPEKQEMAAGSPASPV